MKKIISTALIIFSVLILVLTVHGRSGNPTEETINSTIWTGDGPFELSPERGRFALLYSLVENKSASFSIPIAKFATPDLGYKDGRYVSLFAQGLSFISIPGYVLGKLVGASQVGAFLTTAVFAILNFILIREIAKKLGASDIAASIGALIFLFATPAFSYATTLYQHHISTFLILFSIYSLMKFSEFKALAAVFFLYAIGISVDYPNALLMLPIFIFSLGKFMTKRIGKNKTRFTLHTGRLFSLLVLIPPLVFLLWFNNFSYGSPWQLPGTVESVEAIDEQGYPIFGWQTRKENQEEGIRLLRGNSALTTFDTRNIRNGLYILILSPDRGIIYFAPVLLFAVFGYTEIRKRGNSLTQLLVLLIGVNLLIYSMWGDPWGGWAFGSRYLIPGYALMSIFLAGSLSKITKRPVMLLILLIAVSYSVMVNTAGAASSISNPPRIEATPLEMLTGKVEKYTFWRNVDVLLEGKSKSFVYGAYFDKYITPWTYYILISGSVFLVLTSLLAYLNLSQSNRTGKI